jgi:proline iminopeptidase
MERLREHLGTERWLLSGGSWGSTLALAYAEQYPERVTEIVLAAITSGRRVEADWLYYGASRFFPVEWERFLAGAAAGRPAAASMAAGGAAGPGGAAGLGGAADSSGLAGLGDGSGGDGDGTDAGWPFSAEYPGLELAGAYARLMDDPDAAVRARAARDWCDWEDTVLSLEPNARPGGSGIEAGAGAEAFVRICAHYAANGAWLPEGQVIEQAGRLAGIPGVLIHGKLDLSCPLETAWELSKAWPGAELLAPADSGHLGSPTKRALLLDALDRFAPGQAR